MSGVSLRSLALVMAALGLVVPAHAEPVEAIESHRLAPRGRFELGYGVSQRDDSQTVDPIGMSAQGLSPLHLRGGAAFFFGDVFGLWADGAAEPLTLSGSDLGGSPVELGVTGMRFSGGLALRMPVGDSFALEADLGYGYGHIPARELSGVTPGVFPVRHHGPAAALRVGWERGTLAPRLRVRAFPVAFGEAATGEVKAWQVGAGAELGIGNMALAGLEWSLLLSYEFGLTRAEGSGLALSQTAHQGALGLRAALPGALVTVGPPPPPPPPTGPGWIRGKLLLDDTPGPGQVEIVGAGTVQADSLGLFRVERMGPGLVKLRARAAGFKPGEAEVEVPPEAEAYVEVKVLRPTGPGRIVGTVSSKPAEGEKTPLAGAKIQAGELVVETDASGSFVIAAAGPGPVPLVITAKGHQPGEEVVSVPPEAEARAELVLLPEKVKQKATLRGLVRNVGGKPVRARLKVIEAKARLTTNAQGEFELAVPGGRYRVVITASGYRQQTKVVEVADGDQAIFNIDLEPIRRGRP